MAHWSDMPRILEIQGFPAFFMHGGPEYMTVLVNSGPECMAVLIRKRSSFPELLDMDQMNLLE